MELHNPKYCQSIKLTLWKVSSSFKVKYSRLSNLIETKDIMQCDQMNSVEWHKNKPESGVLRLKYGSLAYVQGLNWQLVSNCIRFYSITLRTDWESETNVYCASSFPKTVVLSMMKILLFNVIFSSLSAKVKSAVRDSFFCSKDTRSFLHKLLSFCYQKTKLNGQ